MADAIRALYPMWFKGLLFVKDARTGQVCRNTFQRTNDVLLARVMLEVKEATGQDVYLEYMFHPTRRWRFDACVPSVMVAVEVEGMAGRSGKSRHMTYGGYQKDMEKYNAATALGWHLLRFVWKDVRDGSATKQIIECVNRLKGAKT